LLSDKITVPRRRERLFPAFVPQWVQQRVEVDNYVLFEFIEQAGTSIQPGARVLDAGAGDGRYQAEFAHTRYVGIDLAVGDPVADYSRLDVLGDLAQMPFKTETFDAILCTQVLEHVREPQRVLQELGRVLRPGGRLFLSAPQSWHQHQKPNDYYRYTSFGLRYLLEKVKLNVEMIRPMGGYFWFLSYQLQNINFWLFPKGRPGRIWTWPVRALFGFVFQLFFPLILFYLDRLDHIQDETFGYVCIAAKPEANL
jgi:SAM-dependent methyltransferase